MICIRPNPFAKASDLQRMLSDALSDLKEFYIAVEEGPINAAVASIVENLLLSTEYQEKRWTVRLNRCYPMDEEARSILTQAFHKAFSQGRIGELVLKCFNSTDGRGRGMLLSVFGAAGPSDNNQRRNQQDPLNLRIMQCIFDHTMIPHLQSWARDAATFSELDVHGDCFRWPGTPTTTECIAKMFEQAREKPTRLEFWRMSLIGDMACLRDWRLESIMILGSCQVRTLSGLSSMAPSLKALEMYSTENLHYSLTELGTGITALLEDPNCCLEILALSSAFVEDAFALTLFQALGNIRSLISLDMYSITVNDPSIGSAMIDYLRANPPSLKYLSVHESLILGIPSAVENICHTMRSENHTLEQFRINGADAGNRELNATVFSSLVRNRAGRRILLGEQVPPSLMAEVLGRTQRMKIKSYYCTTQDMIQSMRVDATYHLVKEGLAFLFPQRR